MQDLLSAQVATLSTFSTIISRLGGEDALRIWYSDKAKQEWVFDPSEALVYRPTVSELIEGCGLPFYLSCNVPKHWRAANAQDGECDIGHGETAGEAVARLWLLLESK
jgi:hypothetical protein